MGTNMRSHVRRGLLAFVVAACGETSEGALEPRGDDEIADDSDAPDPSAPSAQADAPTGSLRDAAPGVPAQPVDAAITDAGVATPADARAPATSVGEAGSSSVADLSDALLAGLCAETMSWDPQATAYEDEVLALTNRARAQGHDCATRGVFKPTGPVTLEPRLRCAARLHSKYMASTGDFSHEQAATGKDVDARLRDVGYRYSSYGENIAYGQRTPAEVVAGWLDSDGHCAIMLSPSFKHIGIGYATRSSGGRATPYWTQDYGTAR